MAYHSFEELDVWKRACKLNVTIYNLFRDCKDWSFRDQVLRSSLSIPSNIAEGAERNSIPEFKRFLHIAKGSSGELRTQLYIAEKIELINTIDVKPLVEELKEISSMLHGLIKAQDP